MKPNYCSITYSYWVDDCDCNVEHSQSSTSTSDRVHIGIPILGNSADEYNFSVTASNGTYMVMVEGYFITSKLKYKCVHPDKFY